ncbi:hypothetical protein [Salinibacter ruber]|nr:hypothetical protein [Salinibacter ruber]MCS4099960.1 hypothetical protein [Salinibacter ruber]
MRRSGGRSEEKSEAPIGANTDNPNERIAMYAPNSMEYAPDSMDELDVTG